MSISFDSVKGDYSAVICGICWKKLTRNAVTHDDKPYAFHQECIDRWLTIANTCPVCRESVKRSWKRIIIRVFKNNLLQASGAVLGALGGAVASAALVASKLESDKAIKLLMKLTLEQIREMPVGEMSQLISTPMSSCINPTVVGIAILSGAVAASIINNTDQSALLRLSRAFGCGIVIACVTNLVIY